jgi:hypothetical protein
MKHKQTVLRIGLPDGMRLYPSQFREMLAKIPELPNALFHRDEKGQTINERPGIRVAGATGWVGLIADENCSKLLREAAGAAILAVGGYTGRPCPVQIEEFDFNLKRLMEPKIYWIREMAIKRMRPRALAMDTESLIAERTLKSIEAACDMYGIECPTVDELGIKTVEVVHEQGLRVQTTNGPTNLFCTLVDAKVMIHGDLEGFWFVGNFTSRGYGRIIRPRPGMYFDAPRVGELLR